MPLTTLSARVLALFTTAVVAVPPASFAQWNPETYRTQTDPTVTTETDNTQDVSPETVSGSGLTENRPPLQGNAPLRDGDNPDKRAQTNPRLGTMGLVQGGRDFIENAGLAGDYATKTTKGNTTTYKDGDGKILATATTTSNQKGIQIEIRNNANELVATYQTDKKRGTAQLEVQGGQTLDLGVRTYSGNTLVDETDKDQTITVGNGGTMIFNFTAQSAAWGTAKSIDPNDQDLVANFTSSRNDQAGFDDMPGNTIAPLQQAAQAAGSRIDAGGSPTARSGDLLVVNTSQGVDRGQWFIGTNSSAPSATGPAAGGTQFVAGAPTNPAATQSNTGSGGSSPPAVPVTIESRLNGGSVVTAPEKSQIVPAGTEGPVDVTFTDANGNSATVTAYPDTEGRALISTQKIDPAPGSPITVTRNGETASRLVASPASPSRPAVTADATTASPQRIPAGSAPLNSARPDSIPPSVRDAAVAWVKEAGIDASGVVITPVPDSNLYVVSRTDVPGGSAASRLEGIVVSYAGADPVRTADIRSYATNPEPLIVTANFNYGNAFEGDNLNFDNLRNFENILADDAAILAGPQPY